MPILSTTTYKRKHQASDKAAQRRRDWRPCPWWVWHVACRGRHCLFAVKLLAANDTAKRMLRIHARNPFDGADARDEENTNNIWARQLRPQSRVSGTLKTKFDTHVSFWYFLLGRLPDRVHTTGIFTYIHKLSWIGDVYGINAGKQAFRPVISVKFHLVGPSR